MRQQQANGDGQRAQKGKCRRMLSLFEMRDAHAFNDGTVMQYRQPVA